MEQVLHEARRQTKDDCAHVAVKQQAGYEVWGDAEKNIIVEACEGEAKKSHHWKREQKRKEAEPKDVRDALWPVYVLRSQQPECTPKKLKREA